MDGQTRVLVSVHLSDVDADAMRSSKVKQVDGVSMQRKKQWKRRKKKVVRDLLLQEWYWNDDEDVQIDVLERVKQVKIM